MEEAIRSSPSYCIEEGPREENKSLDGTFNSERRRCRWDLKPANVVDPPKAETNLSILCMDDKLEGPAAILQGDCIRDSFSGDNKQSGVNNRRENPGYHTGSASPRGRSYSEAYNSRRNLCNSSDVARSIQPEARFIRRIFGKPDQMRVEKDRNIVGVRRFESQSKWERRNRSKSPGCESKGKGMITRQDEQKCGNQHGFSHRGKNFPAASRSRSMSVRRYKVSRSRSGSSQSLDCERKKRKKTRGFTSQTLGNDKSKFESGFQSRCGKAEPFSGRRRSSSRSYRSTSRSLSPRTWRGMSRDAIDYRRRGLNNPYRYTRGPFFGADRFVNIEDTARTQSSSSAIQRFDGGYGNKMTSGHSRGRGKSWNRHQDQRKKSHLYGPAFDTNVDVNHATCNNRRSANIDGFPYRNRGIESTSFHSGAKCQQWMNGSSGNTFYGRAFGHKAAMRTEPRQNSRHGTTSSNKERQRMEEEATAAATRAARKVEKLSRAIHFQEQEDNPWVDLDMAATVGADGKWASSAAASAVVERGMSEAEAVRETVRIYKEAAKSSGKSKCFSFACGDDLGEAKLREDSDLQDIVRPLSDVRSRENCSKDLKQREFFVCMKDSGVSDGYDICDGEKRTRKFQIDEKGKCFTSGSAVPPNNRDDLEDDSNQKNMDDSLNTRPVLCTKTVESTFGQNIGVFGDKGSSSVQKNANSGTQVIERSYGLVSRGKEATGSFINVASSYKADKTPEKISKALHLSIESAVVASKVGSELVIDALKSGVVAGDYTVDDRKCVAVCRRFEDPTDKEYLRSREEGFAKADAINVDFSMSTAHTSIRFNDIDGSATSAGCDKPVSPALPTTSGAAEEPLEDTKEVEHFSSNVAADWKMEEHLMTENKAEMREKEDAHAHHQDRTDSILYFPNGVVNATVSLRDAGICSMVCNYDSEQTAEGRHASCEHQACGSASESKRPFAGKETYHNSQLGSINSSYDGFQVESKRQKVESGMSVGAEVELDNKRSAEKKNEKCESGANIGVEQVDDSGWRSGDKYSTFGDQEVGLKEFENGEILTDLREAPAVVLRNIHGGGVNEQQNLVERLSQNEGKASGEVMDNSYELTSEGESHSFNAQSARIDYTAKPPDVTRHGETSGTEKKSKGSKVSHISRELWGLLQHDSVVLTTRRATGRQIQSFASVKASTLSEGSGRVLVNSPNDQSASFKSKTTKFAQAGSGTNEGTRDNSQTDINLESGFSVKSQAAKGKTREDGPRSSRSVKRLTSEASIGEALQDVLKSPAGATVSIKPKDIEVRIKSQIGQGMNDELKHEKLTHVGQRSLKEESMHQNGIADDGSIVKLLDDTEVRLTRRMIRQLQDDITEDRAPAHFPPVMQNSKPSPSRERDPFAKYGKKMELKDDRTIFGYVGYRVRVVRYWKDQSSIESFEWAEGVLKYYLPKYRMVFIHFLTNPSCSDVATPCDAPALDYLNDQLVFGSEESDRGWFSLQTDVIRLATDRPVWRRSDMPTLRQQQDSLTDFVDACAASEVKDSRIQSGVSFEEPNNRDGNRMGNYDDGGCQFQSCTNGREVGSTTETLKRQMNICRFCSNPVCLVQKCGISLSELKGLDIGEIGLSYPADVKLDCSQREPEARQGLKEHRELRNSICEGYCKFSTGGHETDSGLSSSTKSNKVNEENMRHKTGFFVPQITTVPGAVEAGASDGYQTTANRFKGEADSPVDIYWGLRCQCCDRVFHAACVQPAYRRIAPPCMNVGALCEEAAQHRRLLQEREPRIARHRQRLESSTAVGGTSSGSAARSKQRQSNTTTEEKNNCPDTTDDVEDDEMPVTSVCMRKERDKRFYVGTWFLGKGQEGAGENVQYKVHRRRVGSNTKHGSWALSFSRARTALLSKDRKLVWQGVQAPGGEHQRLEEPKGDILFIDLNDDRVECTSQCKSTTCNMAVSSFNIHSVNDGHVSGDVREDINRVNEPSEVFVSTKLGEGQLDSRLPITEDGAWSIAHVQTNDEIPIRNLCAASAHAHSSGLIKISAGDPQMVHESHCKSSLCVRLVPDPHSIFGLEEGNKAALSFQWTCGDCAVCVYCCELAALPPAADSSTISLGLSAANACTDKSNNWAGDQSQGTPSCQPFVNCNCCNMFAHGACCYPPAPLMRGNVTYRCDPCRRCVSCDYADLYWPEPANWDSSSYLLCLLCRRKVDRGQFCFICLRTLVDRGMEEEDAPLDDKLEWVQCDGCKAWLHTHCERGLTQEQKACLADSKFVYRCPSCRSNSRWVRYERLVSELVAADKTGEFTYLPDVSYALYWRVIKSPISLSEVRTKVRLRAYEDTSMLVQDVHLLVHNAKTLYMPNTRQYKNALALQKKARELFVGVLEISPRVLMLETCGSCTNDTSQVSSKLTPIGEYEDASDSAYVRSAQHDGMDRQISRFNTTGKGLESLGKRWGGRRNTSAVLQKAANTCTLQAAGSKDPKDFSIHDWLALCGTNADSAEVLARRIKNDILRASNASEIGLPIGTICCLMPPPIFQISYNGDYIPLTGEAGGYDGLERTLCSNPPEPPPFRCVPYLVHFPQIIHCTELDGGSYDGLSSSAISVGAATAATPRQQQADSGASGRRLVRIKRRRDTDGSCPTNAFGVGTSIQQVRCGNQFEPSTADASVLASPPSRTSTPPANEHFPVGFGVSEEAFMDNGLSTSVKGKARSAESEERQQPAAVTTSVTLDFTGVRDKFTTDISTAKCAFVLPSPSRVQYFLRALSHIYGIWNIADCCYDGQISFSTDSGGGVMTECETVHDNDVNRFREYGKVDRFMYEHQTDELSACPLLWQDCCALCGSFAYPWLMLNCRICAESYHSFCVAMAPRLSSVVGKKRNQTEKCLQADEWESLSFDAVLEASASGILHFECPRCAVCVYCGTTASSLHPLDARNFYPNSLPLLLPHLTKLKQEMHTGGQVFDSAVILGENSACRSRVTLEPAKLNDLLKKHCMLVWRCIGCGESAHESCLSEGACMDGRQTVQQTTPGSQNETFQYIPNNIVNKIVKLGGQEEGKDRHLPSNVAQPLMNVLALRDAILKSQDNLQYLERQTQNILQRLDPQIQKPPNAAPLLEMQATSTFVTDSVPLPSPGVHDAGGNIPAVSFLPSKPENFGEINSSFDLAQLNFATSQWGTEQKHIQQLLPIEGQAAQTSSKEQMTSSNSLNNEALLGRVDSCEAKEQICKVMHDIGEGNENSESDHGEVQKDGYSLRIHGETASAGPVSEMSLPQRFAHINRLSAPSAVVEDHSSVAMNIQNLKVINKQGDIMVSPFGDGVGRSKSAEHEGSMYVGMTLPNAIEHSIREPVESCISAPHTPTDLKMVDVSEPKGCETATWTADANHGADAPPESDGLSANDIFQMSAGACIGVNPFKQIFNQLEPHKSNSALPVSLPQQQPSGSNRLFYENGFLKCQPLQSQAVSFPESTGGPVHFRDDIKEEIPYFPNFEAKSSFLFGFQNGSVAPQVKTLAITGNTDVSESMATKCGWSYIAPQLKLNSNISGSQLISSELQNQQFMQSHVHDRAERCLKLASATRPVVQHANFMHNLGANTCRKLVRNPQPTSRIDAGYQAGGLHSDLGCTAENANKISGNVHHPSQPQKGILSNQSRYSGGSIQNNRPPYRRFLRRNATPISAICESCTKSESVRFSNMAYQSLLQLLCPLETLSMRLPCLVDPVHNQVKDNESAADVTKDRFDMESNHVVFAQCSWCSKLDIVKRTNCNRSSGDKESDKPFDGQCMDKGSGNRERSILREDGSHRNLFVSGNYIEGFCFLCRKKLADEGEIALDIVSNNTEVIMERMRVNNCASEALIDMKLIISTILRQASKRFGMSENPKFHSVESSTISGVPDRTGNKHNNCSGVTHGPNISDDAIDRVSVHIIDKLILLKTGNFSAKLLDAGQQTFKAALQLACSILDSEHISHQLRQLLQGALACKIGEYAEWIAQQKTRCQGARSGKSSDCALKIWTNPDLLSTLCMLAAEASSTSTGTTVSERKFVEPIENRRELALRLRHLRALRVLSSQTEGLKSHIGKLASERSTSLLVEIVTKRVLMGDHLVCENQDVIPHKFSCDGASRLCLFCGHYGDRLVTGSLVPFGNHWVHSLCCCWAISNLPEGAEAVPSASLFCNEHLWYLLNRMRTFGLSQCGIESYNIRSNGMTSSAEVANSNSLGELLRSHPRKLDILDETGPKSFILPFERLPEVLPPIEVSEDAVELAVTKASTCVCTWCGEAGAYVRCSGRSSCPLRLHLYCAYRASYLQNDLRQAASTLANHTGPRSSMDITDTANSCQNFEQDESFRANVSDEGLTEYKCKRDSLKSEMFPVRMFLSLRQLWCCSCWALGCSEPGHYRNTFDGPLRLSSKNFDFYRELHRTDGNGDASQFSKRELAFDNGQRMMSSTSVPNFLKGLHISQALKDDPLFFAMEGLKGGGVTQIALRFLLQSVRVVQNQSRSSSEVDVLRAPLVAGSVCRQQRMERNKFFSLLSTTQKALPSVIGAFDVLDSLDAVASSFVSPQLIYSVDRPWVGGWPVGTNLPLTHLYGNKFHFFDLPATVNGQNGNASAVYAVDTPEHCITEAAERALRIRQHSNLEASPSCQTQGSEQILEASRIFNFVNRSNFCGNRFCSSVSKSLRELSRHALVKGFSHGLLRQGSLTVLSVGSGMPYTGTGPLFPFGYVAVRRFWAIPEPICEICGQRKRGMGICSRPTATQSDFKSFSLGLTVREATIQSENSNNPSLADGSAAGSCLSEDRCENGFSHNSERNIKRDWPRASYVCAIVSRDNRPFFTLDVLRKPEIRLRKTVKDCENLTGNNDHNQWGDDTQDKSQQGEGVCPFKYSGDESCVKCTWGWRVAEGYDIDAVVGVLLDRVNAINLNKKESMRSAEKVLAKRSSKCVSQSATHCGRECNKDNIQVNTTSNGSTSAAYCVSPATDKIVREWRRQDGYEFFGLNCSLVRQRLFQQLPSVLFQRLKRQLQIHAPLPPPTGASGIPAAGAGRSTFCEPYDRSLFTIGSEEAAELFTHAVAGEGSESASSETVGGALNSTGSFGARGGTGRARVGCGRRSYDVMTGSVLYRLLQGRDMDERLVVKPSKIHGLGLYTKVPLAAGEPVIEYVGTVVRNVISDKKECLYSAEKGGDGSCYMFRQDELHVVDAAKRGNMARFINHSCAPKCTCRILTSDSGTHHIVIFAREDIPAGEEITYDYQFGIEGDGDKLTCLCGAPSCLGRMN